MTRIVLLPGDGIGPEVVAQARACLHVIQDRCDLDFQFEEHDFGGVAIDRHGDPLPETTLAACREADAILLGAVGGPKWDNAPIRPERGLLRIRSELGLYANLRPARTVPGLEGYSPLRPEIAKGSDILCVRELTGGAYFGEKVLGDDAASDICAYSRAEIERVAHVAFKAARRRQGRVTSVDKANVLATSKLWRKVVDEVAVQYPDVTLDHQLVDSCAMAIIQNPRRFDVILTENLFGDILSDELSVIGGSIGLLGSASTGDGPDGAGTGVGLFEPIHGSAPDLAGTDVANPAGTIMAAAMLLDHLGHFHLATILTKAVEDVLGDGLRTADLGGEARCSEFGRAVRERIELLLSKMEALEELVATNRGVCG